MWLTRWLRKIGFMKQQRPLPSGDVRVIGLVHGGHLIEDIGRDVPYGETITIAAAQAHQSKDLWRGISQKSLARLPTIATTPAYVPPTAFPDSERLRLEAQVRSLEVQVHTLENQVRTLSAEKLTLQDELRRAGEGQAQKLDTILAALQNGIPVVAAGPGVQRAAAHTPKQEVADGAAPTFLPSEIKPKDVSVRIDIQGEASTSDVSSAAERLRQLRKGEGR